MELAKEQHGLSDSLKLQRRAADGVGSQSPSNQLKALKTNLDMVSLFLSWGDLLAPYYQQPCGCGGWQRARNIARRDERRSRPCATRTPAWIVPRADRTPVPTCASLRCEDQLILRSTCLSLCGTYCSNVHGRMYVFRR